VHIRLLAIGDRQPEWVDTGFTNYCNRFPAAWKFRLDTIAVAQRSKSASAENAIAAEAAKILQKLKPAEQVVALDERGRQFSSSELAGQLGSWQTDGRDLSFVIGGPDGLAGDCLQRADSIWSLSKLTLPHGLARILFAEQLYRAWSLTQGHPYHRS
jgi:23S rRNA (pseudouridine1915-N3)-methyltransferase